MNERKSNIELLRILAVYFVVVHHIIMHYVLHNFSLDYCTLWLESSILNKLTSSLFYSFGGVGVLCFFMITGYFLAEKTESGAIKKVFLTVIFYGLLGAFFSITKGLLFNKAIDKMLLIKQLFFPISSGLWWFPLSYIIIVIVAPIINKLTMPLNKNGFLIVLLFIALWLCFGGSIIDAPFGRLQDSLFYYLCGIFYKRFVRIEYIRPRLNLFMLLLFFAFLGISYYMYFSLQFSASTNISYIPYFFILVFFKPIVGFLLFSLFISFKLQSKCVNFIASTTFGVYLCHENWYGAYLFSNILFKFDKYFLSNLFPLYILASGVIMFFICGGIDSIRKFIFEPLALKVFDKIQLLFREKLIVEI